jgi:hypothetical protein
LQTWASPPQFLSHGVKGKLPRFGHRSDLPEPDGGPGIYLHAVAIVTDLTGSKHGYKAATQRATALLERFGIMARSTP